MLNHITMASNNNKKHNVLNKFHHTIYCKQCLVILPFPTRELYEAVLCVVSVNFI